MGCAAPLLLEGGRSNPSVTSRYGSLLLPIPAADTGALLMTSLTLKACEARQDPNARAGRCRGPAAQ